MSFIKKRLWFLSTRFLTMYLILNCNLSRQAVVFIRETFQKELVSHLQAYMKLIAAYLWRVQAWNPWGFCGYLYTTIIFDTTQHIENRKPQSGLNVQPSNDANQYPDIVQHRFQRYRCQIYTWLPQSAQQGPIPFELSKFLYIFINTVLQKQLWKVKLY